MDGEGIDNKRGNEWSETDLYKGKKVVGLGKEGVPII